MKRLLWCIPFVVFFCFVEVAVSGENPFESNLQGTLASGTKYELHVREIEFKLTKESQPDDGSMWGIDGGFPSFIIKEFRLTLNGKRADILRKALWDICNVFTARVIERDSIIVVTLEGGDAAGSFTAEFKVSAYTLLGEEEAAYRLSERIVRMGEMPDEIWERTEYHFDQ